MNTCFVCNHQGPDVNRVIYQHVGGQGDMPFSVCDDNKACIKRLRFECLRCPASFPSLTELVEHCEEKHQVAPTVTLEDLDATAQKIRTLTDRLGKARAGQGNRPDTNQACLSQKGE